MFPFWIITFRHLNLNWKSLVGPKKLASQISGEEQSLFLTPKTQTYPEFNIFSYFWDKGKNCGFESFFRSYVIEVKMLPYLFPGLAI